MSVLEKVRSSGKCPPSLLSIDSDTEFEATAVKVVDANGKSVSRVYTYVYAWLVHLISWPSLPSFLILCYLWIFAELYLSYGPTVRVDFKKLLEVR